MMWAGQSYRVQQIGSGWCSGWCPLHLESHLPPVASIRWASAQAECQPAKHSTPDSTQAFEFHPVTPERLADLDRFSQAHGKFRYCSCMRWRLISTEYQRSTKETRVAALEERVSADTAVSVLAYLDGEPVGWCSVAPRETYAALERYQVLARVDDAPVWSVVCFFVDRKVHRKGVTRGLLRGSRVRALLRRRYRRGVSRRAGPAPVHLHGLPCDLSRRRLSRRHSAGPYPTRAALCDS
jgi:GNAT superfamily N-acetyltransferase